MTIRKAKIVIAGLDDAGKTSILFTLAGEYEPSRIQPTRGSDRGEFTLFGIPMIRWDLGGQLTYRSTYFQENIYVWEEVDLLIYVIDVRDAQRFQEALQYYKQILNYLKETNQKPPIICQFHKVDPEYIDTSECQEALKHLKKMFQKNSSGFQCKFLVTSIFDKKSLVETGGIMILTQLSSIIKQYRRSI